MPISAPWHPSCPPIPARPTCSGAFRLNRLFAADATGRGLAGCPAVPFSTAAVPADLLEELGCIWNSYALPRNNAALWESIWSGEGREEGACTGLSQADWMRTAVTLRDR